MLLELTTIKIILCFQTLVRRLSVWHYQSPTDIVGNRKYPHFPSLLRSVGLDMHLSPEMYISQNVTKSSLREQYYLGLSPE